MDVKNWPLKHLKLLHWNYIKIKIMNTNINWLLYLGSCSYDVKNDNLHCLKNFHNTIFKQYELLIQASSLKFLCLMITYYLIQFLTYQLHTRKKYNILTFLNNAKEFFFFVIFGSTVIIIKTHFRHDGNEYLKCLGF